MAKDYTFEDIENYLEGGMTAEDQQKFELAVHEDVSLANSLKEQRETHQLVELFARSQIKNKVKSVYDRRQSGKGVGKAGFPLMKIAAAIALLIVAATIYLFVGFNHNPAYLADQAFEPYPNRFRTMGESEKTDFNKGLDAYDDEDYLEAIARFSKINPEDEMYMDAQFYLGVSNLGSEQYNEALAPFKYVIQQKSLYEGSAKWYLCLTYLQLDQEDEAIKILRSIADEGGKKAKAAQELLDELNSMFRDFPFVK